MPRNIFERKKFTPIEKLDYVLSHLKRRDQPLYMIEIYDSLGKLNNIDWNDTLRIVYKLVDDGYVTALPQSDKSDKYRISFNGFIFSGYVKLQKTQKIEYNLKRAELFILSGAGIFTAIYYFIEIIKSLCNNAHS